MQICYSIKNSLESGYEICVLKDLYPSWILPQYVMSKKVRSAELKMVVLI